MLNQLRQEASRIESLEQENAYLKEELGSQETKHQSEQRELMKELEDAHLQLDQYKVLVKDLESIRDGLAHDTQLKGLELTDLRTAVEDLRKRAELNTVKPFVEHLTVEKLKELQTRTLEAEAASRNLHQKLDASQGEAARLSSILVQMEAEEVAKSRELTALESENRQLKNQIKVLLEEGARLKDMFSDMAVSQADNSSLRETKRELDAAGKRIRESEAKQAVLMLEKAELERAVEQLSLRLKEKQSTQPVESNSTQPKVSDGLQATVKAIKQKPIETASDVHGVSIETLLELKSQRRALEEARHENQQLLSDLSQYRELLLHANELNRQQELQIAQLEREVKGLRAQVSDTKRDLEVNRAEKRVAADPYSPSASPAWETQLMSVQQENERLREENAALRKSNTRIEKLQLELNEMKVVLL